jgi:predicted transcriptional regulator
MNKTKPEPESMNQTEPNHRLLTLPRGRERRESHFQIVIATLQFLYPERPTRDLLQKASRIRRKRFIVVLKQLVESGAVIKSGKGTKKDPFKYCLAG